MLPLSACMDLTESKTCSTTSVFKLNHCYQSTNTGHVVYSLEIDFALFKDANHGSFDLDVVSVPPFCVKLQLTLLSEPVDYYSTIIGVCSIIRCQSSAQKWSACRWSLEASYACTETVRLRDEAEILRVCFKMKSTFESQWQNWAVPGDLTKSFETKSLAARNNKRYEMRKLARLCRSEILSHLQKMVDRLCVRQKIPMIDRASRKTTRNRWIQVFIYSSVWCMPRFRHHSPMKVIHNPSLNTKWGEEGRYFCQLQTI